MSRIIASERLNSHWTAYTVEAPDVALAAEPGHLVMARFKVAPHEQTLFTPHPIIESDSAEGTIVIVGRGLPGLEGSPAASVEITGRAGASIFVPQSVRVLCAAESLGGAALLPRLHAYKKAGCYTVVIAGYASKDMIFWRDRLDALSDEFYLVTEDGSYGIKGPMKYTVKAICENASEIERVVAVGPLPFLKSVADVTQRYDIPTWVSLAAVVESEDQMVTRGGEGTQKSYDWSRVADIDAATINFDSLTQKLGLQLVK